MRSIKISICIWTAFLLHLCQYASATFSYCEGIQPKRYFDSADRHSSAVIGNVHTKGFEVEEGARQFCYGPGLQKFRTVDGSCNHALNYGTSFTPLTRLLHPEYDDGKGSPRQRGLGGSALPSPRRVSSLAHPPASSIRGLTLMVMQWGQFLDHDLSLLPVASEFEGPFKCCGPDGGLPPFNTNRECFPIEIPEEETHFAGKCMEFVRSIPATDSFGQNIRPREQINSLTSFIDGSNIYGSTYEVAESLRDIGYLLKTSHGDFLPENFESDCIKRPGSNDYCFLAGDIRVTEQPGLAAMHTIWVREHNRIARELKLLKLSASDEIVFQTTRKIIGALLQVITYNEYLPIVLGRDVAALRLLSRTGRSSYIPGIDPRIANIFSSAAFRYGHSLVPESFPIGNRSVPLREMFNRPWPVLDHFDELVEGLTGGPIRQYLQKADRNVVEELTNFLFDPPTGPPGRGFDLVSLNIQRGRDHGIPPYVKWRAFCGLRPLNGFNDTEALGPHANDLAQVYSSVADIDAFTGFLHEPTDTGLVGPTLRCLLGNQFFRAKYGDRFFFDTDNEHTGFTDVQLEALRNVTLSKVICQNVRLKSLPLSAFRFPSELNPAVLCSQQRLEGLDLSLFASDME